MTASTEWALRTSIGIPEPLRRRVANGETDATRTDCGVHTNKGIIPVRWRRQARKHDPPLAILVVSHCC